MRSLNKECVAFADVCEIPFATGLLLDGLDGPARRRNHRRHSAGRATISQQLITLNNCDLAA